MKNSVEIMRNIEKLGKRYYGKYLAPWDKEKLKNNRWEALKFFFSHSFMRGRRDILSNEYDCFTINTLENYFDIGRDLDRAYNRLKEQKEYFDKKDILKFKKEKNLGRGNSVKNIDFPKQVAEKNPIVEALTTPNEIEIQWDDKTYKKAIFLGNDEDIMMVLDILKFISEDRKNIYHYVVDTIANFGLKRVYKELTGMRAISDKIATFIIRDIGLLNSGLINKDYEMAFPVDTWVNKIADKLGCIGENIERTKSCLIENCKKYNIYPLNFAAGLWFLGFHSLDILLENCLDNIKF